VLPAPAFGEADLSNCEREQIQFAGSIQPHGALLVVREPELEIVQASDNAAALLALDAHPAGVGLEALGGNLARRVRAHLADALHRIPVAVRCTAGARARAFDVQMHRPPQGGLVIELERAGPRFEPTRTVREAVATISAAPSLETLGDDTARLFKQLTGYHRVMVYRFDSDGHGEVYREAREPRLEPYLGNRYPASDIPQIARRLYQRNRVRVLVDVEYQPVALTPRRSPLTGEELDMSLCLLRSMSPIHLQYLQNMGVRATLVASLAVGGRLWGLIACHHYEPRAIQYELRAVCELLAETVATRIAALESFAQSHAELSVRRIEQRMIEAISRDGDWRAALFDGSDAVLQPLGASGAALLFEGQILTAGEVPATRDLRALCAWLDSLDPAPLHATASLGSDNPQLAHLAPVASGVLATPLSSSRGEYLVWFRPERVHTVTWGGNPNEPVVIGNDPSDLSPRRSFAQWHQLVEGTADDWSAANRAAARLIGESVADVILQFRSVRMLILEDQLEQAGRQVRQAEHPAVVADAQGRILLTNDCFDRLLRAGRPHLQWIDDLPALFARPEEVRRNLAELLESWRPWRGEVQARTVSGEELPLLLRADPVFASRERVLGFVLLFTDLAQRKSAEAARRQFQESVIRNLASFKTRNGSHDALARRQLFTAVVDNAQLAALEITDGVDLARMPDMLEGVRTSVTRCTELLEHLDWYAQESQESRGDEDGRQGPGSE